MSINMSFIFFLACPKTFSGDVGEDLPLNFLGGVINGSDAGPSMGGISRRGRSPAILFIIWKT